MKNKSLFSLFTGFLTLLSSIRASAETEYRILTFDRHSTDKELVASSEKGQDGDTIPLAKNNFSDTFKTDSAKLFFYREGQVEEGKEVGAVSLDAEGARKLVLIVVPQLEGNYTIVKVNDDTSFSKGQRLMVNISPHEIGGKLESQAFRVAPGNMNILQPIEDKNGRGTIESEVRMRIKGEEKWRPLSSSIWKHDAKARSYVFFYWDEKKKRVRIRSVREVMP